MGSEGAVIERWRLKTRFFLLHKESRGASMDNRLLVLYILVMTKTLYALLRQR